MQHLVFSLQVFQKAYTQSSLFALTCDENIIEDFTKKMGNIKASKVAIK